MKSIKNKINSNKGASFLFGLFALFVALMISAVAISSALTSARRVKDDYDTTQSLLTLESTASLVKDELLNSVYRKKFYYTEGNKTSEEVQSSGLFKEEINQIFDDFFISNRTIDEFDFVFKYEDLNNISREHGASLKDVSVKLVASKMDNMDNGVKYNFTIEDPSNGNACFLYVESTFDSSTTTNGEKTTVVYDLKLNEGSSHITNLGGSQ